MFHTKKKNLGIAKWRSDSGQVTIVVVLALGIFLLGFLGFAVDMTNLWFHRQMAQGAADAACQAAAMDLLYRAEGVTVGAAGNFSTAAGAVNCTPGSAETPCWYARTNGYNSDTTSNLVTYQSYPAGTTPPGFLPPAPTPVPVPFFRVDVVDHVGMTFSSLITRRGTSDVRAFAVCGVTEAVVPVPLLILDPSRPCTFFPRGTGNTPKIAIIGGPSQSVQVNSSDPTRATCANGNPIIDLSRGGPGFSGSDFGVFGGPTSPPFVFAGGSTGQYVSPHSPISDPFATLPAPGRPGAPALGVNGTHVNFPLHGCPTAAGGCTEYSGGYYPNGIQVKNATAIFDPGLYYLEGNRGLSLDANSIVRPSDSTAPDPDGYGGTTFYFASSASVSTAANSGGTTNVAFQTSGAPCPGGLPLDPAIGVPATLNGNVLLGPCTGPYGAVDTDPDTGATTPARGMLFFQNRATNGAGSWSGGGQFLLAGTIYFHQCNASGTGVNCGTPPAYYNASFDFGGNSCSSTYVIGYIVTDQLLQHGTPCIKMVLDPYNLQRVLKATMFR